jgi:hypothetical protein
MAEASRTSGIATCCRSLAAVFDVQPRDAHGTVSRPGILEVGATPKTEKVE